MTGTDEVSDLIFATTRPPGATEGRPVGGDAREASTAAARLLELAASSADELVAEAKAEAASLVSAARAEADEVRAATQRRREEQHAELEEHRSTVLAEVEERRQSLLDQVAKLRGLEEEHRDGMRRHLEAQLALLDSVEPAVLQAVAGE